MQGRESSVTVQTTLDQLMPKLVSIHAAEATSVSRLNEINNFLLKHNLGNEAVPPTISNFLNKFINMGEMKPQDFIEFRSELKKINNESMYNFIVGFVNLASRSIYGSYAELINTSVAEIENAIASNNPIPKSNNPTLLYGLMNVHLLQNLGPALSCKTLVGDYFPPEDAKAQVTRDLVPMGINALKLTGRLIDAGNYCNIDMSKAIYPNAKINPRDGLYQPVVDKPGTDIKGVKKASEYFPFKPVSKLAKGGTGDQTYMATNGEKILYVRSLQNYSPNAVLASKIATLISPMNFSSERVLSNRLTGARAHSGYSVAISDPRTVEAQRNFLDNQKRVFSGTGVIDEVLNFVNEGDPNIENLGFSNKNNIAGSHLVKIDFDQCRVEEPLDKKKYEKDFVSNKAMYRNKDHQSNSIYITEKIATRLKLAFLPQELLSGLSKKAYIDDPKSGKKATSELTRRTEMAFDLLMDKKNLQQLKGVLTQNPGLLHQIRTEAGNYITKHFDQPVRDKILKEYDKKHRDLSKKIISKCDLKHIIDLDKAPGVAEMPKAAGVTPPVAPPSRPQPIVAAPVIPPPQSVSGAPKAPVTSSSSRSIFAKLQAPAKPLPSIPGVPANSSARPSIVEPLATNSTQQPISNSHITINGKLYPALINPADMRPQEVKVYSANILLGNPPLLSMNSIETLKDLSTAGAMHPVQGRENEYAQASLYAAKAVCLSSQITPIHLRVSEQTDSMRLFLRAVAQNVTQEVKQDALNWAVGLATTSLMNSAAVVTPTQIDLAIQIAGKARELSTPGLDNLETAIKISINYIKSDDKKGLEAKLNSALPKVKAGISSVESIGGAEVRPLGSDRLRFK